MQRTLIGAAGAAGILALVLTGCTTTGGETDGPVTITYTNFISNGGNEENLQTIVDANPAAPLRPPTATYLTGPSATATNNIHFPQRGVTLRDSGTNYEIQVVTLPVSDVDRARTFYTEQAGFTLDVDYHPSADFRVVQLTPPGSGCAIQLGIGLTDAPPGSARTTYLVDAKTYAPVEIERVTLMTSRRGSRLRLFGPIIRTVYDRYERIPLDAQSEHLLRLGGERG